MQKASIMGNVGREPEVRHTGTGTPVCSVGIAVHVGADAPAVWYDCSVWGEDAMRFAEKINKGDRLCLDGNLQLGMRKDSATDTFVMNAKINVKNWHIVSRARQVEQVVAEGAEAPTTENLDAAFAAATSTPEPDDIPF